MTALEHNKFVGYAHLGYAAIHILMLILMFGVMSVVVTTMIGQAERFNDPPPAKLFGLMFAVVGIINLALTVPSVVAGYGFLKRRQWAKVAGIIAGVVACMHFPIGTAVGVYTFWFLFGEMGKSVYEPNETSPPPPESWARSNQTSI